MDGVAHQRHPAGAFQSFRSARRPLSRLRPALAGTNDPLEPWTVLRVGKSPAFALDKPRQLGVGDTLGNGGLGEVFRQERLYLREV